MIVRTHPRQAWQALLWGAICLFGFLVAAEVLLPRWLELNYDRNYAVRRDRLVRRLNADAAADRAPSLVVMLGSSRAISGWHAFLAEKNLTSSFEREVRVANFATPGNGPVHHLVQVGRLLRDKVRPDALLIEVLPAFLRDAPLQEIMPPASVPLSPADADWLRSHGLALDEAYTPRAAGGLSLCMYRTDLIRRVFPQLLPGESNWVDTTDPWGGLIFSEVKATLDEPTPEFVAYCDRAHEWAKKQYFHVVSQFRYGGPGVTALEGTLRACRDHRLRAVLVLMPEGPEFRGWYRPGVREQIARELHSLAVRYDAECINAWEWLDEEDFVDSHHMLGRGNYRFTTGVCEHLADPQRSDVRIIAERADGGTLRR